MASWDWYYGFKKRHPCIVLRTPKQISIQRVKGFIKEAVDRLFAQLGSLYDELKLTRDRIWNMDETGFPTVAAQVKKILAEKGSKHVGQMSSAERGTNVSAALAVSAAGQFIPPFYIFPELTFNRNTCCFHKTKKAMPTKVAICKPKNFINSWNIFQKKSYASKDNPVLLLLDNHMSHLSIASAFQVG